MKDTKTKFQEYNCAVTTTLDLIGGKYKPLIVWHLLNSALPTLRFGELRKLIPQATPKMLTQQLRELERDELIIRTVYPVVPPKVEYELTDLGKTLEPILRDMCDWGTCFLQKNYKSPNCTMVSSTER